jgi:FlaA1/EpsC-like NDP-sugar epimerase/lipopolysaccharide/colanic/teichoic acid biosynthesis glycosyltransferase
VAARPLRLTGLRSISDSLVLRQQSAILAFLVLWIAAIQRVMPDVVDWLSVVAEDGALVVLPAIGRRWWRGHVGCGLAGRKAGAVLLIGGDPDLAIIAVDVVRRGRQPIRVATVEEAHAICPTISCDAAIVSADALTAGDQLVDGQGRVLDIKTSRYVVERLLGRVHLDPTAPFESQRIECAGAYERHRHAKRAADLLIGFVLGVVFLMPTLLTASLLWLARQRPIFERVQCAGRYGHGFDLFRFNIPPQINEGPAGAETISRGDRTIRAAHVLSRLHLALGPTLWNVLRGEMSVIGPRPESIVAADQDPALAQLHQQRSLVKPGLISLARVRFGSSNSPRDAWLALEYDLYYTKYWSLGLDVRILGRACWRLLGGWRQLVRGGLLRLWFVWDRHLASWRARSVRPADLASVPIPRDLIYGGRPLKPALIVGAGSGGEHLSRELRRRPIWGLWPVAFIDDDPAKFGRRINGVPVLGDVSALPALVQREKIDTVVIAIPSAPEIAIKRLADAARLTGARVLRMPDIGMALRGGSAIALQSVPVIDILGRPTVDPDIERCRAFLCGKRVLVTGAAGSIGREVMRQVAQCNPAATFGLDINESGLFDLEQELQADLPDVRFTPVVASITDTGVMRVLLERYQPEVVFHAAAYKHVPMMEEQPSVAIGTNTVATYHLARHAAAIGVHRFVLVSTDKAVRPSNAMGASKRLAELAVRDVARETGLSACAVRFGNVLGSRGSVIPLFEKQIAAGGPVTVTDERMMRYFMTIPEAAGLIIQAGAFGHTDVIYMLDMGEEIAIRELAERLIRLRGFTVGEDIEIVYTGVRAGEKLRESLAHDFETARPTAHPKIRILVGDRCSAGPAKSMASVIRSLTEITRWRDEAAVREAIMRIVHTADNLTVDEADDSR